MGYKVKWTEAAASDAENYAEFIARDSQGYASYFAYEIRQLAKTLRQMPERGRIVPVLNRQDVRELIWSNYRIIYQIGVDTVAIIAIVHGARLLDIAELKDKLD